MDEEENDLLATPIAEATPEPIVPPAIPIAQPVNVEDPEFPDVYMDHQFNEQLDGDWRVPQINPQPQIPPHRRMNWIAEEYYFQHETIEERNRNTYYDMDITRHRPDLYHWLPTDVHLADRAAVVATPIVTAGTGITTGTTVTATTNTTGANNTIAAQQIFLENIVQRLGVRRHPAINDNLRETGQGHNMNYDQLARRFSVLTDRYFPFLSNKDNAFSALQVIDNDRSATPEEKAALREYVGGHTTASTYNYQWCNDCESMVGIPDHTHCPHCTYPCITPATQTNTFTTTNIVACGFCGECCRAKGHRYCPACNGHTEKLCRHCSKCAACCVCQLCPVRNCQEMQECEDCHKCLDHCTCPALQANGPYGRTFPAIKKKDRKLFDCSRMAGVEWEFCRINTQRYFDYWIKKWLGSRHEDASCGYEAVTAPIAGDHMVKCLEALGKVFEKSRALIDNRCSIHVHADAKDIQWADMFRLLKVYSLVEPILYMLAGQDRLDNRYCIPCGKDYAAALDRIDRKDAIMAVAFTPITREGRKNEINLVPDIGRDAQRAKPGRRADVHLNCRRRGLNILPWLAGRGPRPKTPIHVTAQANDTVETIAQRNGVSVAALMRWNKIKPDARFNAGQRLIINKRTIAPDTTVEFRIHANTTDAKRVINWTKIVLRLVDWAAKSTDKDLENLPKSPLRILCQVIAPECAPWIISRVKEWRKETSRYSGTIPRRITIKGGKYSY